MNKWLGPLRICIIRVFPRFVGGSSMREATSSSLALRPEVLPCTLQILSYDRHPVLGYITRLAFAYERTLTSKLMILHGTQQKSPTPTTRDRALLPLSRTSLTDFRSYVLSI